MALHLCSGRDTRTHWSTASSWRHLELRQVHSTAAAQKNVSVIARTGSDRCLPRPPLLDRPGRQMWPKSRGGPLKVPPPPVLKVSRAAEVCV